MPRLFLHLESAALLIAVLAAYARLEYSWWTFALLLLAPDLSLLLYPINPRAASVVYNLVHTTVFPIMLAAYGLLTGGASALQIALVWFAHIGMDRAIGYGLKYSGEFKSHFTRV
jgi:hypothetical protein